MQVEREIVFPESPAELWEALTEPERLEEWFATEVELDPRPGGRGVFRWGDGEERRATVREAGRAGAARPRLGGRRRRGRTRARGGRRRDAPDDRRDHAGVRDRARAARTRVGPRRIDHVFAALGDPGRRSLVEAVSARGSATATELAADLPVIAAGGREAVTTARRRGASPRDPRGPRDAIRGDAWAARRRRRVDGRGRRAVG